ncbi:MAG: glutathione S-transferase family protein [Burkholderiaceae bacterium]|nr:glutathione S-transferase family protein [Burkholderiaceae bacterium]
MSPKLTLISHTLCPYVQRVAIVLAEKNVPFERIDIDLACKPDWFLKISPLGKTPVLLVNEQAIFESSVICEYLEETMLPRLHPEDALQRARHRGWMEFGSSILNSIGAFYNAQTEEALRERVLQLRGQFEQLEQMFGAGPYFDGDRFCMVDAVFGPVFRYFDVFESFNDFGFFNELPKVRHWRYALKDRKSVLLAAHEDYRQLLCNFLVRRNSALSAHLKNHR